MQIHLAPDKTAFVQLVTFLAVLAGLSFFIFKPIRKIIEARRDRTEKLLNEAKAIEDRVKASSEEYFQQIESAKMSAAEEKEKMHQMGLKEDAAIRAKARFEANDIINTARIKIEDAKVKTIEDLENDIPKLAEEIIAKVKS